MSESKMRNAKRKEMQVKLLLAVAKVIQAIAQLLLALHTLNVF